MLDWNASISPSDPHQVTFYPIHTDIHIRIFKFHLTHMYLCLYTYFLIHTLTFDLTLCLAFYLIYTYIYTYTYIYIYIYIHIYIYSIYIYIQYIYIYIQYIYIYMTYVLTSDLSFSWHIFGRVISLSIWQSSLTYCFSILYGYLTF